MRSVHFLGRWQNNQQTILLKSLEEIKTKRLGMLSRGVIYHHDNAPAHRSAVAMAAFHATKFAIINFRITMYVAIFRLLFRFVDDPIEENVPPPQLSNQSIREKELHFQKYFYEIAGEDMEVNAFQFRQVLNMGLKTGRNCKDISMDACHSMLSLVDVSFTSLSYQFLCMRPS